MGSVKLTRESILDGTLHASVRSLLGPRYLATGAGPIGRCCDYLFDTVEHLRQLGIRDRRLEALEAKVRAHGAAQ